MVQPTHVIDLDGTLANCEHRQHFLQRDPPDWKSFLSPELVAKDPPIPEGIAAATRIIRAGKPFLFLTGRGTDLYATSRRWLLDQLPILQGKTFSLITRPPEWDGVPGSEFKVHVLETLGVPVIAYDDDDRILAAVAKVAVALKAPGCWPHVLPDPPPDMIPETVWRPRRSW